MKFRLFFLGVLLFFNSIVLGQHYKSNKDKVRILGSVGLGLGQENLISLPKLSGMVSFKLNNGTYSKLGQLQKFSFYVGTEASIVVFFAGAFSISGTGGFKTGPITTDCSLTKLYLVNPDGNVVARQTTLNPKIGVMIGQVWIKTGPSFLLSEYDIFRETFGNFMHIGNVAFNFEVNYYFAL
jgi:hypothetical protein